MLTDAVFKLALDQRDYSDRGRRLAGLLEAMARRVRNEPQYVGDMLMLGGDTIRLVSIDAE